MFFIESINTNVSIIEHNIVNTKYDVKLNFAIFVKWSNAFYDAFVNSSNISSDFIFKSGGILAFFIISWVYGSVFNNENPKNPLIRWGINHHTWPSSWGIKKNMIKIRKNIDVSIIELQKTFDITSSMMNSIFTIRSKIENPRFKWELVGNTALDNIDAPNFLAASISLALFNPAIPKDPAPDSL